MIPIEWDISIETANPLCADAIVTCNIIAFISLLIPHCRSPLDAVEIPKYHGFRVMYKTWAKLLLAATVHDDYIGISLDGIKVAMEHSSDCMDTTW